MLSPLLVNLPSGIATSLAPKPRKPPVLMWIALTDPSGAALTLCTVPSLLPSEEKTASPTRGFTLPGVVADRGGVVGRAAGGVGAVSGLVAAGGDELGGEG